MLSLEFQEFFQKWIEKADQYGTAEIRELFDKFFTLYVLYNRIYAEATFEHARNGGIDLTHQRFFPDSKAATVRGQKDSPSKVITFPP